MSVLVPRTACRTAAAVLTVLGLVLTAACGSSSGGSPPPSPKSKFAFAGCVTPQDGEAFTAKVDGGAAVEGAVLGSGSRGVVISHERDTTACDWLPIARELAADGYQVALWEYGELTGLDRVDELAAVVGRMRDGGVEELALVGGSMGGCLSMIGASRIKPPVAGVAVLSCAGTYDIRDRIPTRPEAAKVTVPAFYLVAENDEFFDKLTAEDFAAIKSKDKIRIVVPDSDAHGVAIFEVPEHGRDAKRKLFAFLERVTD